MSENDRAAVGRKIEATRKKRPIISLDRLAEVAQLAPNTVSAVQRGAGSETSTAAVLAALASLGRPVDLAADVDEQERPPERADAVAELVRLVLSTAPTEQEYLDLERNLWLLLRGQHDELVRRLSAT